MKVFFSWLILAISTVSFAQNNQMLVLSGGGSPAGNHYSQYLQTKTVYEDLSGRLPYQVDVFFGAGNNLSQPAVYADVHKIEKTADLTFEKYIPGTIKNNSAATKENVHDFFKNKVGKTLDTFFMVISDHGMPNMVNGQRDTTFSNNCIDLWNAKAEGQMILDLGTFDQARCLSKNELKDLLKTYVPAKKMVFAMSQCFSGGFHQMSITEPHGYPKADVNVCGFTAVTEDTYASGCSPDVDGPSYQGYERSFTEQLTGVDYVNSKKLRAPRASFSEAHEAALLEDLTVDIPLSTSEYFLWRWAKKIIRVDYLPRTKGDVVAARSFFTEAANFKYDVDAVGFKNKKTLFLKMGDVIKTKFPDIAAAVDLPVSGLAEKLKDIEHQQALVNRKYSQVSQQAGQLFNQHAVQMWFKQLANGSKLGLTEQELNAENYILNVQKKFNRSGSQWIQSRMLPILWISDAATAGALSIYISQRNDKMTSFALASGNTETVEALSRMKELEKQLEAIGQEYDGLSKRHGLLRRLLIYRQTLGAWAALTKLNEQTALQDVEDLLACEATKL